MLTKKTTLKMAFAIAALTTLVLTGCTPKAPAEPTMSPDSIYTAAAQTVAAEVATREASKPTATLTFTPLPTNTLPVTPIAQASQPAAGTPGAPVATGGVLPSLTPLPTFTSAAPAAPASTAKYELVAQDPADDTKIAAGVSFDAVWTIKNTGTVTWTKKYTLVFFIGERMNPGSKSNVYTFANDVKPGEQIQVKADMAAPTKAGTYHSWWKLKDENGQNFGDVDITIKVE